MTAQLMKRYFLANFPQPTKQTEKRHNEVQGMFSRKKIKNTLAAKQLFNRYKRPQLVGIKKVFKFRNF